MAERGETNSVSPVLYRAWSLVTETFIKFSTCLAPCPLGRRKFWEAENFFGGEARCGVSAGNSDIIEALEGIPNLLAQFLRPTGILKVPWPWSILITNFVALHLQLIHNCINYLYHILPVLAFITLRGCLWNLRLYSACSHFKTVPRNSVFSALSAVPATFAQNTNLHICTRHCGTFLLSIIN